MPAAATRRSPGACRGCSTLRAQGLLQRGNQEFRQAYLDQVGALLEEVGVRLRLGRDHPTGRWDDPSLPWERWNHLQRRPGPTPPTHVTCPWCGSDQVELVGVVGPTVMTSQWRCTACSSPFERIRRRGLVVSGQAADEHHRRGPRGARPPPTPPAEPGGLSGWPWRSSSPGTAPPWTRARSSPRRRC